MRRRIVGASLALACGALVAAGCGDRVEQDARRAADAIADEAEGLEGAAKEGAAAQAARDVGAAGRAAADAIDTRGLAGAAEEAADEAARGAAARVENSVRVEKETYDAARKAGEGVVEAAGDAENAVLAIPDEKEDKEKAQP